MHSSTLLKLATGLASFGYASAAFDANSNKNLAMYWGQSSAGQEDSLGSYCDQTAGDIYLISFLSSFGQGTPTLTVDGCDGSSCTDIGNDIKKCQSAGKKILLSLGGAIGQYGFQSDSEAETFADTLWNMYGGGQGSDRPFGDAQVDGFDLDIENNNQVGYTALVKKLREHYSGADKDYYVSAAPQCVYPDANVGKALAGAQIDFAFVQFYNNYCSIGSQFNYDTWSDFAKNDSPNKNLKIFIGLPGSTSAAGSGYVTPDKVQQAVQQIGSDSSLGGIMLWDASQGFSNKIDGTTFADQMQNILDGNTGSGSTPSSAAPSSPAAPSSAPAGGAPSSAPVGGAPSSAPVGGAPSSAPAWSPSSAPAGGAPSSAPAWAPSSAPSWAPSSAPAEGAPSSAPSSAPAWAPSSAPAEGAPSSAPAEGAPSSAPVTSPGQTGAASAPASLLTPSALGGNRKQLESGLNLGSSSAEATSQGTTSQEASSSVQQSSSAQESATSQEASSSSQVPTSQGAPTSQEATPTPESSDCDLESTVVSTIISTSQPPVSSPETPVSSTQAPSATSEAPAPTSQAPGPSSEPSSPSSEAPVSTSQAPVSTSQVPTSSTQVSTSTSQAPNSSDSPVTSAPAEGTGKRIKPSDIPDECKGKTDDDLKQCLNGDFTKTKAESGESCDKEGDMTCKDGKFAVCNYNKWVLFDCPAGTTCTALTQGSDGFVGCGFPDNKSKRDSKYVLGKLHGPIKH